MDALVYGALDIGGTKIAGGLVDADGHLVARSQCATPAHGTAEEMMAAVAAVLDDIAVHPEWNAISHLGIGSAGPVDTVAGTVSPVNIPAWRAFPLAERIRALPASRAASSPLWWGTRSR